MHHSHTARRQGSHAPGVQSAPQRLELDDKPRNAWAHYILAIHKGKEGHWILIKGVKLCDTFTQGKWQFVVDGPQGARIMEAFEVKRQVMPDGLDVTASDAAPAAG